MITTSENIEKKDIKKITDLYVKTITGDAINIEPTEEEDKSAINLINIFREKSKCTYGIFVSGFLEKNIKSQKIESILGNVIKLMENYVFKFYVGKIHTFKNHWVNFFNALNEPLYLFSLKFQNLEYHNEIFIGTYKFKYGYIIKENFPLKDTLLNHLLNRGYKEIELEPYETKNIKLEKYWKVIGYQFKFSASFTSEEEAYFLFKYFTFYNIFSFWNNLIDFKLDNLNNLNISENEKKWLKRDKNISTLLKNIISDFFIIKENKFPKEFNFKFNNRDLNKELLRKIYIKFLFSKQYKLEKRLDFYYFNRINLI